MLSWTFVVAAVALCLIPPGVPAALRTALLAGVSIGAVTIVWHVPIVTLLAGAGLVYAIGLALPRLPAGARGGALGAASLAVVAALVLAKPAANGGAETTAASVVGLSYLALKLLQHLVDAADGRAGDVGLPAFLCDLFFLPTYSAGPIERTGRFARELNRTDRSWSERALGLERVVLGIGKKLILADPLLTYAQPLLHDPASGSPLAVLAAIYAFAFGLYLDFGGYSDIAIGLARCAGVQVPENFDAPYLAKNINLLWQRWHMSLTSWLRDYVFLPSTRRFLRWTRRPLPSQVAGQLVTMVLCGLWHGLAWHYALWGLYNGVGLAVLAAWRAWRGPAPAAEPWRDALSTCATFHFFAAGLVLFACDLPQTGRVAVRLLDLFG